MARLSFDRLAEILEAYGAAAERWPAEERMAAERLIAQSAAARALWEEAAALDRMLDNVPASPAAPALAARVLAAAPRRRPARVWRRLVVTAIPLAAAATLVVWLAGERESAQQVASTKTETAVVEVGEYASPTDVLLEPFAYDVTARMPSVGCADSVLGCPAVDEAEQPYSHREVPGRSYA
jgi:hypothetical protein